MESKALVKALKIAVREVIKEELSEILREGVPSYGDLMQEGMSDMSFTANDAQGFGMMRGGNNTPQIMKDPESGKNMQIDPAIAKAMTRDYRGLMKAMDKQKNKGFAL